MGKNRSIFFFCFVLLLIVIAGAVCPAGAKTAVQVRVGYFPNITHAQALVGMETGRFAQELGPGVKILPFLFNAGPSAMEALLTGELDLVYVGPNPALNTYLRSKGKALRILAGACSGGAALVLQKERKVSCPTEFAHLKLGTPQLGNTQDVALRYYLKQNKLKTKEEGGSVSVYPAGNSNLLLLFCRGEIDGAWTVEPWVSRLIFEAQGYVFLDEKDLWPSGIYPTTYLVGATDFIAQHPELVKKWVGVHVRLTCELQENPEQYIPVLNAHLAKWLGRPMPVHLLQAAFNRLKFTCRPMRESLELMAERAYTLGFLKSLPTDFTTAFELLFLQSVTREYGYAQIP